MKSKLTILLLVITVGSVLAQDSTQHQQNTSPALIQLFPIVVSSLALLLSMFNYYTQYHIGPNLSIMLSDNLKSWLSGDKFVCHNTLTLFNKGAQYGSVYKIAGTLSHTPTNTHSELKWNMFVQDRNIGKPGQKFIPHISFEGWAETLVIQGRTAITKKIQFRSIDAFKLQQGDYVLEIFIFSGTDKKHACSAIKKFTIDAPILTKWAETINSFDPTNRVAKEAITIRLHD